MDAHKATKDRVFAIVIVSVISLNSTRFSVLDVLLARIMPYEAGGTDQTSDCCLEERPQSERSAAKMGLLRQVSLPQSPAIPRP